MPNFDGRGPRHGGIGKGKGPCRGSRGRGFSGASLFFKIMGLLITSGIAKKSLSYVKKKFFPKLSKEYLIQKQSKEVVRWHKDSEEDKAGAQDAEWEEVHEED